MNWSRLALAAILPIAIALPVAALFWRRNRVTVGSVVGAGVVLSCTILFMALEFGEGVHYRLMCAEQSLPCRPRSKHAGSSGTGHPSGGESRDSDHRPQQVDTTPIPA